MTEKHLDRKCACGLVISDETARVFVYLIMSPSSGVLIAFATRALAEERIRIEDNHDLWTIEEVPVIGSGPTVPHNEPNR